jgi:hypothetical protein
MEENKQIKKEETKNDGALCNNLVNLTCRSRNKNIFIFKKAIRQVLYRIAYSIC